MVDPTVVVLKITVHDEPLPTFYSGPSTRAHNKSR